MSVPRFILYTRQSLTRGEADDSLSLAFQERSLRELVAKQGGIVLEPVIVDADEKGWDPHRPGIAKLVERTERERPDGVAVYAVSRFARDNWLAEGIWRRLIDIRPDLQFLSATEPHAHDDMVRGILGVISQAERKRIGTFLRSSFAERAHNGKPHGKTPFCFTKDENGRLVPHEEYADWARQVIDHFEEGWSLWKIAVWLNEHGVAGRRWEPNTVRNIIKSPALAGGVKCGQVLEWDCHPPIISREQHERVVRLLAERRYTRTKNVHSWLERSIFCTCGAPMDLNRVNHPRGAYANFRCAASPSLQTFQRRQSWPVCESHPRTMTKAKAERLTIEALTASLSGVQDWREVERRAQREYRANESSGAAKRRTLEKERTRLADERERLLVLYRRATLDVDRWERDDKDIADKLAAIDAELARNPAPPPASVLQDRAEKLMIISDRIRLLAVGDQEQIGAIMREIGVMVQIHPGGVRLRWPEELAMFFVNDSAVV